jgi:hypothetical protein
VTDADPTVLFIGGAGRSGSTLLECMLGEVPGVVAAGEVTHLWDRGLMEDQLCGCGRPFSECLFWRDVMDRAFADGLPDTPEGLMRLKRRALSVLRGPFSAGARRRYAGLLVSLYRAIADVAGARVVVDSSKYPPEAYLLRGAVRAQGLGVRFVHLVRDPNAVVYSWQRTRVRPEIHDRRAHMPRYPWWQTTAAWVTYNALFDLLGRLQPGAVLRVQYDELMADAAGAVRRITAHAGLEAPRLDFIRDHEVALGANHTVSGNPSRFRTGPVELRPDTEWREQAPRWQVRAVEALTVPQRLAYGRARRGAP